MNFIVVKNTRFKDKSSRELEKDLYNVKRSRGGRHRDYYRDKYSK